MSTQKTVEIQNNKVLTITARKNGFKPITKSIIVTQNQTQNITMIPSESQTNVFTLGDRLLGIASFVCYFTPSGTYDTKSLYYISAKQTVGNSLTDVSVAKTQWLSYVEGTLSIATTQGSSSSFVFTYNGSTWDLTGATTISGITATELQDNFGITFSGTPTTDDVITVTETYYNKFACFVLDGNYRADLLYNGSGFNSNYPVGYTEGNAGTCKESATYFSWWYRNNDNVYQNWPAFMQCVNLPSFILPNGIVLYSYLPNPTEGKTILENSSALDTYDESSTNPLTNIERAWLSAQYNSTPADSSLYAVWSSGAQTYIFKQYSSGGMKCWAIPIFELPCM